MYFFNFLASLPKIIFNWSSISTTPLAPSFIIPSLFALVTSLIGASNEEVGICREFIRKYCDPEYLSIYDLCWIGNSIEKAEIISELQSSAKSLVKTINKVGQ